MLTSTKKNIGGYMLLLQSWIWDQITCISPTIVEYIEAGLGFSFGEYVTFYALHNVLEFNTYIFWLIK